MGFSQWPIVIASHFNQSGLKIPSCVSLFMMGYHTRAPSQSVSNYMFLLEAPVSCVASPFVNVGKTGLRPTSIERKASPGHHTGVSLPRQPGFMASHRHVRNEKGTLVWAQCLASIARQQVAFLSQETWSVCPARSAVQWNFNPTSQGCVWVFWVTFSGSDGHSIKALFPWKQTVASGYLKSFDTDARPSQQDWTGNFSIS